MYKFRKEWNDVQPIGQEGQEIEIEFRAVLASGEKSERALNLTTHAINLNPNNYEVWDCRRKIIKAIKYDVQKELYYMDYLIRENPKNHLAWVHRRMVANTYLNFLELKGELSLTGSILNLEPKSYNAWEYRQWILNAFKFTTSGLVQDELDFTTKFIEEDVRNNSAWNQRFFIIKKYRSLEINYIRQEFLFALEKLQNVLDNESVWNYLRGILTSFGEKKLRQCDEVSLKDFLRLMPKIKYTLYFLDCPIC
jgi:protein farnesyltransferase/geranylgeranyltransferase type-1 subunit alpha